MRLLAAGQALETRKQAQILMYEAGVFEKDKKTWNTGLQRHDAYRAREAWVEEKSEE